LLASFGDTVPERTACRRTLLKSAKSLNGHAFKSKLAYYAIPYLASKIDNHERANEFETLTMVDTGPQSNVSEYPGDKAAPDVLPRRRAPPKADRDEFGWYLDGNRVTKAQDVNDFNWQLDDDRVTKSQDINEFRWQLDDNRVTSVEKIHNGGDSTANRRRLLKSAKSLNGNAFKSKLAHCTTPYLASKIDNDEPANALKTPTMLDTGPQSEGSE
jgi:hypothetical protein